MFRCRYSDPFSSDKKPSARPSFCHGGTSKHTNFPCRVSAEPAACQFLQNEMHFYGRKSSRFCRRCCHNINHFALSRKNYPKTSCLPSCKGYTARFDLTTVLPDPKCDRRWLFPILPSGHPGNNRRRVAASCLPVFAAFKIKKTPQGRYFDLWSE